jgi:hypothetical protein
MKYPTIIDTIARIPRGAPTLTDICEPDATGASKSDVLRAVVLVPAIFADVVAALEVVVTFVLVMTLVVVVVLAEVVVVAAFGTFVVYKSPKSVSPPFGEARRAISQILITECEIRAKNLHHVVVDLYTPNQARTLNVNNDYPIRKEITTISLNPGS